MLSYDILPVLRSDTVLGSSVTYLQGKVNTTLGKSHKALERSGNAESKSQHPSLDSLVNATYQPGVSEHEITREPGEHCLT